jgi:hypothetical protein
MSALLVFIKVYRQSVSQFPLHAIFKNSRQLGFGVFIVIWSMLYLILHVNLHNVVLQLCKTALYTAVYLNICFNSLGEFAEQSKICLL